MLWKEVLAAHGARYPRMEPEDYGKLVYQSCFGPEHMISGPEQVEEGILREWRALEGACSPEGPEAIGGGLCRFPLSLLRDERDAAVLARLFAATARTYGKRPEELEAGLERLEELDVSGMERWLPEYRAAGCPPVSHSERYRREYHPHYRILKQEYAKLFPIFRELVELFEGKEPIILAIDGRCGSGKSSLGRVLEEVFACPVAHMDDYYLPVGKRADNWMEIPAGNMDLERFRAEVLEPARRGEQVCYRPYCCQTGETGEERRADPAPVLVVEGSYSHHPMLRECYDRTVFLTCGKEEQLRRLQEREGDYFPRFREVWMPLEERYFRVFEVEQSADLVVDTGEEMAVCMKKSDRP